MEKLVLKAEKREINGKKVRSLRKRGFLPAIIYGHKVKNISLKIPLADFEKMYKKAGESSLIELKVDKSPSRPVLIHDVQFDKVRGSILHADFYQVKMKEKITSSVPLGFIGKSKAVEEKEGVLIKNLDEIEVKCLPAHLPKSIQVDISKLNTFDDVILVKDLEISKEVKVLADKEEIVAKVQPPRTEEELKELEEEVKEEVEEVEGVKEEEGIPEGEEKVEEEEVPAEESKEKEEKEKEEKEKEEKEKEEKKG